MKNLNKLVFVFVATFYSVFSFGQNGDTIEIQRNQKGQINFARFKPVANRKLADGALFLHKILATKSDHEFRLVKEERDELGMLHQRYAQYWKGIKLESAEYLIHGRNGIIETINGDYPEINSISTSPGISESDAIARAINYVGARKYKWEDVKLERFIKDNEKNANATYYPKGELVFSMDNLRGSKYYLLSWKFTISSLEPENEQLIYVNAANGDIIGDVPLICNINIPCTAQTRYSGTQNITGDTFAGGNRLHEVRTTTAGNTANIVTLNIQNGFNTATAVDFVNNTANFTLGNWATFNQNQQALDVHWGIERVLDYWATVHQRNSINGLGLQATSYVHFLGSSAQGWPNNAQWDATGHEMRFGDGDGTTFNPLVSLDITAHELGHGINQFTANLTPGTAESGALNEGFSDIWGASVENWAAPNKQTWLIGEEIFATSSFTCIRNLQNPKSSTAAEGKHPDTYNGQFWATNGEPHNNSTVLSHWFYLLSQGGSGTNDNSNNYYVSGIGITSARRIAFRALSLYLTATSGYSNARTQTINATRDLFCDNSPEVKAVTNAWYAVGVGAAFTGTLANITGSEPICTTRTFLVSNQPAGVTNVTWTSGNTNALTVNAATGLVTRVNNFSGLVKLNATYTGQGNCSTVVTKDIWVGNPTITYVNKLCVGAEATYQFIAPSISGASYTWSINNSNLDIATNNYMCEVGTSVGPGNGTQSYVLTLNVQQGNCLVSKTRQGVYVDCVGGGGTFSVYPNPASNELSVEFIPDATVSSTLSTQSPETVSATVSSVEFSVKMINSSSQTVLTGNSQSGKISLDTHNLQPGLYYLNINKNGEITTEQILVKK